MATSALFWENSDFGPGDTNATYEFLNGRSPNKYHLMRLLRKQGMREFGEILHSLMTDVTAGQVPTTTASVIVSQVTATADTTDNVQGGVRGITAQERMHLTIAQDKDDASANTSRAVTAADVTEIIEMLVGADDTAGHGDRIMRAPTDASGNILYVTDASGNGGGGKFDQGF
jgi:hypothetical protein